MTQLVRFWEARIVDGALDAGLAWVHDVLVPRAVEAGAFAYEVVASEADAVLEQPARIVVLTRWTGVPSFVEPDADPSVVARAHAWNFRTVDG